MKSVVSPEKGGLLPIFTETGRGDAPGVLTMTLATQQHLTATPDVAIAGIYPQYFLLTTPNSCKAFVARNASHARYCCDAAFKSLDTESTEWPEWPTYGSYWRAVEGKTTTTWYQHARENDERTGVAFTAVNGDVLDKETALDTLQECLPAFGIEDLQFRLTRSAMPPMPLCEESERHLISYLAS